MKADYLSPHEGAWHRNDFVVGEQYVTDDHVFTVMEVNDLPYDRLMLTVEWEDRPHADKRVWPNMQWIALNWTDDEGRTP